MASLGLINRVKYSPFLYNIYYYLGSFTINILQLVVKKDPKLIVFSCYGGRKYDDSPKCIFEMMVRDSRFDDYKLVWTFMTPEKYNVVRGEKVKTDTFAYFITLLKARCWITNSTMERGLSIKHKDVFYYNSWHGTPIKLMGADISKDNKSFGSKDHKCPYDVFCAQSKYDADIFTRSFHIPENVMKIIGLPRNDELLNDADEYRRNKIKKALGIEENKKVILYAPTFREYTKDENMNCIMIPPVNFLKWKKQLSKEYVMLFRAHYEVVKVMNVISDDFFIDVSSYQNLNELMIASDMLISDYSSIYFDYSIMEKPMLCFAYDYNEYQANRGLYFDVRKELECIDMDTEEKVLYEILTMDTEKRKTITKSFRNKYVTSYGSATKQSLDLIFDGIASVDKSRIKIIRAATVPESLDTFCKGMLRELSGKYEVVGLSSPGEALDRVAEREGVRTIAVPMERHISLKRDFVSLWRLMRTFLKEKPTMVHSMTPKAGLICMMAGRLTGVPVRVHTFTGLVWPTESGIKRRVLMFTDRLTCACATHIIPEGEGVKNDLIAERITQKPLKVLGYGNVKGVDMVKCSRRPEVMDIAEKLRKEGRFTFLYVGRVVRDKGINELCSAFERLHNDYPRTRLVLVGPFEDALDPISEKSRKIISENEAIEAVGAKGGDELLAYYAAADCFVMPSYREGFPNTVLEAGAMDLPSIVTDINGSREIIHDGENGMIVPPKDEESLYRTMIVMLTSNADRNNMAKKARNMIAERFEQNFVHKCLYDFYDEILPTA